MPSTAGYPFRRLSVDHLIVGVTRVWWELHYQFRDPLPYIFQLQVGGSGNPDATDWVDVGTLAVNTCVAYDDERRIGDYGKRLLTHYRVKLSSPLATYISQPVATYGELNDRDWLLAREIVRKEQLRHELVSRDGFLLKRMRFGERCTVCLDPLTGEIRDSNCPECNGTGFKVGYYAPTPLIVDMGPEAVIELLSATEPPGPTRPVDLRGRILGFPQVNKQDVWVDAKSDQRWFIDEVLHAAEWRGVPLIVQIKVQLAPYTDRIYNINVDVNQNPTATLPTVGPGTVLVDHDYGGPDTLAYLDRCGDGIIGATILAFNKVDYDNGIRDATSAVAASTTTVGGRWMTAMLLCANEEYMLVFEKAGYFGPDTVTLIAVPS